MALSIDSEGNDVAKYLVAKGVTAFVLKYRIAHTGEDAAQEFMDLFADRQKFEEKVSKVIPLSIADGLAAVSYVRGHASDWGVSPDRVGIIGFSAGGTVAAGVGLRYAADGRPAFVALIYAAGGRFKDSPFQWMRHRCLLRLPPMTILAWLRTAWLCTKSGPTRTNRRNCICTRRVAMASECESMISLRIIGSTGLAIGWSYKAG